MKLSLKVLAVIVGSSRWVVWLIRRSDDLREVVGLWLAVSSLAITMSMFDGRWVEEVPDLDLEGRGLEWALEEGELERLLRFSIIMFSMAEGLMGGCFFFGLKMFGRRMCEW